MHSISTSLPKPDRITKRRIAEMQLYRAVKLLEGEGVDYDPLSALTLGGAAEEILGKMVAAKGMDTAVEESTYAAKELWKALTAQAQSGTATVQLPDDKSIRERLNRARNEIKHNDRGKNSPVEAHFWYEAEEMILRALRNYKKLYNKAPPQKEVQEWWDYISL